MSKQLKTITRLRNIYDLDDYYVLEQNGWEIPNNSTLKGTLKKELIEIIRCLEHNWAVEIKANMLLSKRLENFYNYYKEKGQDKLFNEIISKDIEGSDTNENS